MCSPADVIERFLRDNPSGKLQLVVGYASAFGLAWLNEKTTGRPVELLIGDTRTGFSNYTEADRGAAIQFLQRPDVSVTNWYRRRGGHRTAHAKAWAVQPDSAAGTPGAVLVGSANLTRKGLFDNFEMLTLAASEEHERLFGDMRRLMGMSWPVEARLLRLLGADKRPVNLPLGNNSDLEQRRQAAKPYIPATTPPQGRAKAHAETNWSNRLSKGKRAKVTARMIVLLAALSGLLASLGMIGIVVWTVSRLLSNDEGPAGSGESAVGTYIDEMSPATTPEPPVPMTAAPAATSNMRPTESTDLPPTPETDTARPETPTTPPTGGWMPVVEGNSSSYGEPGRLDLQWVSWQPSCLNCEPGATLTVVRSYASETNQEVGTINQLRPLLESACLHRERLGPQINWQQKLNGDRVESVWIDGELSASGLWWTEDMGGSEHPFRDYSHLTIPESGPFLSLIADAQTLRVLTTEGRDATFNIAGFLATPVQANLDHCGYYP